MIAVYRVTESVSITEGGVVVNLARGDLLPGNHPLVARLPHRVEPVEDYVVRLYPSALAEVGDDDTDHRPVRRRHKLGPDTTP